ncbi:MAG: tRNA pseudouridine(13) synthase TruD [Candidatus Methanoplasma sp.]|jgi:tRNA pseudouridine13 synthase|nr:tRNA pseudouridine(13) synthase TruD [Candidatus Methanoplasma sp.]
MTGLRRCSTGEAGVGMLYYLSPSDGTGGRLKTDPEDFVVDEISDMPEPKEGGRFVIAKVTSRNWETNRLIRIMSRELGISRERIGFAGTKDKRGVTSQLMSFECRMEDMSRIGLKDVEVSGAYLGKRRIQIGDLKGNSFKIRVRGCEMPRGEISGALDAAAAAVAEAGGFINYFGVQRFGAIRPVTHKVGELLVRGDVEGAVRAYLSQPSGFEGEEVAAARSGLSSGSDWGEMGAAMPDRMSFEKTMVMHLAESPGDWAGAISMLPKNLQMMFVHAYQSYLFNLMVSERLARGLPLGMPVEGDFMVPLDADGVPMHESPVTVGARNLDLAARQAKSGRALVAIPLFGSESAPSEGEMGEIERAVLEAEGVSASDFIIPGLPNCCSKGSFREILSPVRGLSHKMDGDGYEVSFSLPKGNYATCLMREFMKSEMSCY